MIILALSYDPMIDTGYQEKSDLLAQDRFLDEVTQWLTGLGFEVINGFNNDHINKLCYETAYQNMAIKNLYFIYKLLGFNTKSNRFDMFDVYGTHQFKKIFILDTSDPLYDSLASNNTLDNWKNAIKKVSESYDLPKGKFRLDITIQTHLAAPL